MASLKELRDVRLGKLAKLRSLGIDPYPAVSNKTISNQEIIEKINEINPILNRLFDI